MLDRQWWVGRRGGGGGGHQWPHERDGLLRGGVGGVGVGSELTGGSSLKRMAKRRMKISAVDLDIV